MEVQTDNPGSPLRLAWQAGIAVLALVLVVLGLWALGGAIMAAWGLYSDPQGIEYFAGYLLNATQLAKLVPDAAQGAAQYLAWITVILLLLVLGKLGSWALEAGAKMLRSTRCD